MKPHLKGAAFGNGSARTPVVFPPTARAPPDFTGPPSSEEEIELRGRTAARRGWLKHGPPSSRSPWRLGEGLPSHVRAGSASVAARQETGQRLPLNGGAPA